MFRNGRLLILLVNTALIAVTLCGCLEAQVLYPRPGFWMTVDGQAVDLKPMTVVREHIVKMHDLHGQRVSSAAEEEAAIQREAHKRWCDNVRSTVESLSKEKQIRRFGLTVSQAEVAQYWNEIKERARADGTIKRLEAQAKALSLALEDVYDRHIDPEEVRVSRLKDLHFSKEIWQVYLKQSSTPEERRKLLEREFLATKGYNQSGIPEGLEYSLVMMKLPTVVDDEIARKDAKFAGFLAQQRAETKQGIWMTKVPAGQQNPHDYLQQARARWWDARYREMNVRSSDPGLAGTCQIAWMTQGQ